MELLEFRSCRSMQKLWHQQKTTQGFENFLHVTDSITYHSADLFIIQHHFRLSFWLQFQDYELFK